jgi:hypothetical protein
MQDACHMFIADHAMPTAIMPGGSARDPSLLNLLTTVAWHCQVTLVGPQHLKRGVALHLPLCCYTILGAPTTRRHSDASPVQQHGQHSA